MTPEQVHAACEAFSARIDRVHKVGKACQWVTLSATAGLIASSFDHLLRGAEHGLWLTALFGLSTIGLVGHAYCVHWMEGALERWAAFMEEHLGPPPPEVAEMLKEAKKR